MVRSRGRAAPGGRGARPVAAAGVAGRGARAVAATVVGGDRVGVVAVWVLVLAPAAVLPGGLDRFLLPSLAVTGIGLLLAVVARPAGRLPHAIVAATAAGLVWLTVAALTGDAPLAQLFGRWPRYEGVVALPAYVGALAAGAVLLGPAAGQDRRRAVPRAAAVLAVLVGGVAVLRALGLEVLSSTVSRAGSLLGNATEQGLVGAVALGLLLPGLADAAGSGRPARAEVWRQGVGVTGAVAAVVLSGSRAGLLAAGVVLAVVAVGVVLRGPGRRRGLLTVGAVAVVTVGAALAVPATADRLTGDSPAATSTITGRLLLWDATLDLVGENTWTGAGPSGFVDGVGSHHSLEWAHQVGPANPPDSPHSWPLQAAAAGGLPLAALAFGLAGAVGLLGVRRVLRTRTDAVVPPGEWGLAVGGLAAVLGYGVGLLTHFTTASTTPLVAMLAGLLVATRPRTTSVGPRSRSRYRVGALAVGAVGVAWLVVVLLAVLAERPLAAAYGALGRADVVAAEGAFSDAARLRPWDADVAVMAAHGLAVLAEGGVPGALEAADRWADRALDRVPGSTTALAARATADDLAGHDDAADEVLTRLVQAEPVNAEWWLRRGVVRAEAGRYDAAEADLREAARLAPHSPVPWRNLAVLHEMTGDDDGRRAAEEEAALRATRPSG